MSWSRRRGEDVSTLWHDVRYALRVLRAAPAFTATAVLSLALGIGASAAIFTLIDRILLQPLPVARPHELALVQIRGSFNGGTWDGTRGLSYPMYAEIRDHNAVFSHVFARFARAVHVGYRGQTERAAGELVSGNYFEALGLHAAHGRLIATGDDRVPDGHPVAVLAWRYWQRRFAADPAIVGTAIALNGHPYTVIGVLADGYTGTNRGNDTDIFLPMMQQAHVLPGFRLLDDPRSRFATIFGRLRPGVTLAQAEAGLQPTFLAIRARELTLPALAGSSAGGREEFLRARLEVLSGAHGNSRTRRTLTQPLWVLMAIVGGLLLIAGANVAALLLARATARQREIAIRLALGAGRGRVVRQLLVESLILSLAGAAAGLLVSVWGSTLLLRTAIDPDAVTTLTTEPDLRIVAFALIVAVVTGVLFGLVPAWQSTRPAMAAALTANTRAIAGGGHVRMRQALVVAQVALSLVLIVGAATFVRSLRNLLAADPGFTAAHLVSASVDATLNGDDGARAQQVYRTLIDRVAALPGVESAALASHPLLQGSAWNETLAVDGYTGPPHTDVAALFNAVTPHFFETMRMPLVAGRDFTDRDARMDGAAADPDDPGYRVAIANQTFVDRYLAGGSPLGRRIRLDGAQPIEIVGVVADARHAALRDEIQPQLFVPFLERVNQAGATIYVRTTSEPEHLFTSLRRAVQQIDPGLPLYRMRTMEEDVRRSVGNDRLLAGLSAAFGVLATLLAIVGVYGVMAYVVTRRRREIGLRIALGARIAQVTWLFLRDAVWLVLLGCVMAVPAIVLGARAIASQVYGVEPLDPIAVAVAIGGLTAIATAGALVPVLHGARVDPIAVLRDE